MGANQFNLPAEWTEESGATPTYNNVDGRDPEKWNDLPIRYLQELYPIQDNLMKAFNPIPG
jgi:hypothetical protein